MIKRDNSLICYVCEVVGFSPYTSTTMGHPICSHTCWIAFLEALPALQKRPMLDTSGWRTTYQGPGESGFRKI